jgi:hypothetical protein
MAEVYDTQYGYNLTRYASVTYDQLHLIMSTKLCAWLKRFPHADDIDYCEKAVRVAGGTKTTSEDHIIEVDSELEELQRGTTHIQTGNADDAKTKPEGADKKKEASEDKDSSDDSSDDSSEKE